jgi:uracil-DNA glycosylase
VNGPLTDLVAPDWAAALAPVADQVVAMQQFLQDEQGAGRGYLPAGEHVLRAFAEPMAAVRVLVVGQDPYPTPGHPVGLSFSVHPDVRPLPRSLVNI